MEPLNDQYEAAVITHLQHDQPLATIEQPSIVGAFLLTIH